ncbi:hypothetical protein [Chengkuizengella marina]|uniref:Uncharacterized protein n=1 Tax=Chengkuizengella marina TaxID=2507566 RepID=A0A6N9Q5G5_9BACL|nr:hypothetical protein [Chengkuizengella marina]NBI30010.1 hypothetical protein [Chengkuizengella marina]
MKEIIWKVNDEEAKDAQLELGKRGFLLELSSATILSVIMKLQVQQFITSKDKVVAIVASSY